jgi:hypothetical protein
MTKLALIVYEIQKMFVVYIGYLIIRTLGRKSVQLGRAVFSR